MKLLIVDDDVKFSNQLKVALEQKKYKCLVLNSPEQAIETIKKEKISIVLLDVMMPSLSGFELCRQIRIDREIYNTGVIFLSAMNDAEELEHGFAQGGDDYLVKPISFSLLLSRLETLASSIEADLLIDPPTGLGNSRFIRLELQRTLLLRQSCGFTYIELSGLPFLQSVLLDNDVSKIVAIFAKHLKIITMKFYGKDYQLAHIGNGHFMCLTPTKDLGIFLNDLKKSWEELVPSIYSGYKLPAELLKSKKEPPISLYICALVCNPGSIKSTQSAFDSLRKLYAQCKLQPSNEILIDRRGINTK